MAEELPLVCARPNKRPTAPTDAMLMEAARVIAVDLLRSGDFDEKDTVDDLAADIVKAVRGNWNTVRDNWSIDGYELARELERRCLWSPDASMVGDLECFSVVCNRLLSEAEKLWAAENPMEPPFPLGTVIKHHWGAGPIDHINQYKPFTYSVVIPSKPGSFAIVRFEDAKEV